MRRLRRLDDRDRRLPRRRSPVPAATRSKAATPFAAGQVRAAAGRRGRDDRDPDRAGPSAARRRGVAAGRARNGSSPGRNSPPPWSATGPLTSVPGRRGRAASRSSSAAGARRRPRRGRRDATIRASRSGRGHERREVGDEQDRDQEPRRRRAGWRRRNASAHSDERVQRRSPRLRNPASCSRRAGSRTSKPRTRPRARSQGRAAPADGRPRQRLMFAVAADARAARTRREDHDDPDERDEDGFGRRRGCRRRVRVRVAPQLAQRAVSVLVGFHSAIGWSQVGSVSSGTKTFETNVIGKMTVNDDLLGDLDRRAPTGRARRRATTSRRRTGAAADAGEELARSRCGPSSRRPGR